MMKKKIVVKLGGASLQNENTMTQLTSLLQGLRKNYNVVLVHGGGPAINEELTKRGITWKFINGLRQTTPEMMAVIDEVLAQKVNSEIVTQLNKAEVEALGLSGAKDQILFCVPSDAELMQVGSVEKVNTESIENVLAAEKIPVVAPIGYGSQSEKYNINADWAAAKIAMELKADALIFLTDQDGILDADKKLIRQTTPLEISQLIDGGVISGGMMTKVRTMISALENDVKQVRVINANKASQLLLEGCLGTVLLTENNLSNKDVSQWNHLT